MGSKWVCKAHSTQWIRDLSLSALFMESFWDSGGRNSPSFKVFVGHPSPSHPHEAKQLPVPEWRTQRGEAHMFPPCYPGLSLHWMWTVRVMRITSCVGILIRTVCQVLWNPTDPLLAERWGGRGSGRLSPKRSCHVSRGIGGWEALSQHFCPSTHNLGRHSLSFSGEAGLLRVLCPLMAFTTLLLH